MSINYPFSHSSIVGLGSCMDRTINCTISLSHNRIIEVARAQEAKAFELKAAINVAHVWLDLGHLNEAPDLLLPIYEWFIEDSHLPNPAEAKVLLDEIS